MTRSTFLLITAIIEAATGLALLLAPAIPLELLLGDKQAAPESAFLARVFGAALLAIGVTCYLARNDLHSASQRGVLWGVLVYNVLVAGLLAYAALGLGMKGIAIWPAVVLHTVLAGCGVYLFAAPKPSM